MNWEGLKKNSDFKFVYSKGRSFATKILVMYYRPNQLGHNRIGFSISKKVGKAVIRNRLRRLMKENLKRMNDIKEGYDIIFIARVSMAEADFYHIEKNIKYIFSKTRLIKNIKPDCKK